MEFIHSGLKHLHTRWSGVEGNNFEDAKKNEEFADFVVNSIGN